MPNYECECIIPKYIDVQNAYIGKGMTLRLCCLAKAVEELTGKQFVFPYTISTRNWDEDQENLSRLREKEIAEWDRDNVENADTLGGRPNPYVKKAKPEWIARRQEDV